MVGENEKFFGPPVSKVAACIHTKNFYNGFLSTKGKRGKGGARSSQNPAEEFCEAKERNQDWFIFSFLGIDPAH